ncbi:MAG: hypothetical protein BGO57_14105 [Sphingomonadales bacterium 63-6]|nr:MAG: hypothetical protein BGO57_14105 [Sphingomonadales bacterium 63-6]
MNGQLLVFAGSLAGVLFLVLVAKYLGLGSDARIADEAEARELADNALCGFSASEIVLASGGKGALLRDGQGRIMLLAPHGAQFAGRLLDRDTAVSRDGTCLTLTLSDRTFPPVSMDFGPEAEAWERRITAPEG